MINVIDKNSYEFYMNGKFIDCVVESGLSNISLTCMNEKMHKDIGLVNNEFILKFNKNIAIDMTFCFINWLYPELSLFKKQILWIDYQKIRLQQLEKEINNFEYEYRRRKK